ncbi:hypothetical protein HDZ31DRAFT_33847 [Schizophyllum fasciatum]
MHGTSGVAREEGTRFFGIPKYTTTGKGGIGDYSEIYPEDPYGAEAGENARVWRVYLDESGQFDDDMMRGFRDTLDVHLVFAALFSAVVTTFVVQTSQALQPDYGRIGAAILMELVALQRARSLDDVPSAAVDLNSLSATAGDIWVNALWFTTLGLSLSTVLVAVLVKQWLQEYVKTPSGPPRDRALIRHMRYKELLRWKIPFILSFIPVLLHISLALFLAGLIVFLHALSLSITYVVSVLTGLTYLFYLWTHILAVMHWECSYRTPVTHAVRDLIRRLSSVWYNVRHGFLFALRNQHWNTVDTLRLGAQRVRTFAAIRIRPPLHAGQAEIGAIRMQADRLDQAVLDVMFDSLIWLHENSTNLSARDIISEAIAGWPSPLALNPKADAWRMGLGSVLPSSLHDVTAPGKLEDERGCQGFERWARGLCSIAWEPLSRPTERHGGLMPLFGRQLVTHEDWNLVAEKMQDVATTLMANQHLTNRLLCLRLFYPSQTSPRRNRQAPAPETLLNQVRQAALDPNTRLAPAMWYLLMDYACRRMPSESTIIPSKPLALQLTDTSSLSRPVLSGDALPIVDLWLESILLLVHSRCVPTLTRDGKSRTSLYRSCEGPATLQDACDHHPHVKDRLTNYLCIVLHSNDFTRMETGYNWPQALARLIEYLQYANEPIPRWLADACWTELQSLTPQYHHRISRAYHKSVGTVQNLDQAAIANLADEARQNFQTIFVLYSAARYDAVGDPEVLHTQATVPCRDNKRPRRYALHAFAKEDHELNTVEFPIRSTSLMLDLSMVRTPDREKSTVLLRASLAIFEKHLLNYVQRAHHAIHRHLVHDLLARYVEAILLEKQMLLRGAAEPFLQENTIAWLASICESAHPDHASELARYEEALRRLYRHTCTAPVWHLTLASSAAEVHLANATRSSPWLVLNRYRRQQRFLDVIEGENWEPPDCPGHSLYVYVNAEWLLEQGVAPPGFPDSPVYGPYALAFPDLDRSLEEADADTRTGLAKNFWKFVQGWRSRWRPGRDYNASQGPEQTV